MIHRNARDRCRITWLDQGLRHLREEMALRGGGGLDAHSHDGGGLAGRVDVDEVHFGARADAVDQVLRGVVDVPAGEVDGLVVEGHGGEGGGVVRDGHVEVEGGSEAPVFEGAGCVGGGGVAGEGGGVGVG